MINLVFPPGTYHVELNSQNQPILVDQSGTPMEDPTFETVGSATLTFEIQATGGTDPLLFKDEPISWRSLDGQAISSPAGNAHQLNTEKTVLTLSISNPSPPGQKLHFQLHFSLGDISEELWVADGSRPLDPTIVEKPDEHQ